MGRESTQQPTPDLFSTSEVRENSAALINSGSCKATTVPIASQPPILPENLDHVIKQLTNHELTELIHVALNEAKRRGKSPLQTTGSMQPNPSTEAVRSTEKGSSRKPVIADVTLSPIKLNAVWAAFKAGVTPSRIARQFGISQANVRKVLGAK